MALIVRPPRPMILPMSSGATLSSRSTRESDSVPEPSTFSGSSTTERARSNTSSSSCDTSCSLQNAGDLEQLAHLVGGLGPLAEPLFSLIRIHLDVRSEEHTSELQSRQYLVCRLLLEKKKNTSIT